MRSSLLLALVTAACTTTEPVVVGPYTGEARRFVVDSITLPITGDDWDAVSGDLNGGGPDNVLGSAFRALAGEGLLTNNGADMVAAGAIASSVIITADDFTDDASVSVRYLGTEDADSIEAGGRFEDGRYASNRTARTHVTGAATLVLPVFVDADPSVLPVIGLELELEPDGAGGYDAILRGGVPAASALAAASEAIVQMLESNPGDHIGFMTLVDTVPYDWRATREEVESNFLVESLLAPDLMLAGAPTVSIAFRAHLAPCAEGGCIAGPPAEPCSDRVLDGDETDVDCGGSCHACPAGFACTAGSDCEAGVCDAGTCAAGTCGDGVRDGFEIDADCGQYCNAACAIGARCFDNGDCVTAQCGEPFVCEPGAWFCVDWPAYGTCQ